MTTATSASTEAVQAALAVEHAAIYVLGALGGRTSATSAPALARALTDAYDDHVNAREALAAHVVAAGIEPVAPSAVYDLPSQIRSDAGIGAAALKRVPTLIVQHMPPVFTAVFAEHLSARVGLPAAEGKHDERIEPGRIYVAPGGRHMGLASVAGGTVIKLNDGAPVNFCRPAVDVLFKDAAAIFGAATASVILTGMGSDGTNGARALVEAGGPVLAQDEATSTVWGMPGSVARAGLAEAILPLLEIGPALRAMITGQPA